MDDYGTPMPNFNPAWKRYAASGTAVVALCLLVGTHSRDRSDDLEAQLLLEDASPAGTQTLKRVELRKESATRYVGTTEYKDGSTGTVEVNLNAMGTLGLSSPRAVYAVTNVVAQAPAPPNVIISYAPAGLPNPPGAPGVDNTVTFNAYRSQIGGLRASRTDINYPQQVAALRSQVEADKVLSVTQRNQLLSLLNDEHSSAYAPPPQSDYGSY